jgi:hypothetical protein
VNLSKKLNTLFVSLCCTYHFTTGMEKLHRQQMELLWKMSYQPNPHSMTDADVPSSAIIEDGLGIEVSGADSGGPYCVAQAQRQDNHAGLVAGGDGKDVWAWNNGKKWETKLSMEDNDN